jgi:hypothetical protein
MAIHTLTPWEIVLDSIQIFLCGGILLFLIHNKIKYKRMILNVPPKDNSTAFTEEIQIQTLKQQTEQTFDTILNVIHQEHRALQSYYDIEERKKDTHSLPLGCSERIKNRSRLDGKNRSKSKVMDNGKILMLSKKGLTPKEISRSVRRPRGEVEFILRLNEI